MCATFNDYALWEAWVQLKGPQGHAYDLRTFFVTDDAFTMPDFRTCVIGTDLSLHLVLSVELIDVAIKPSDFRPPKHRVGFIYCDRLHDSTRTGLLAPSEGRSNLGDTLESLRKGGVLAVCETWKGRC